MNIWGYILIAYLVMNFGFICGRYGQEKKEKVGWESLLVCGLFILLVFLALGIIRFY